MKISIEDLKKKGSYTKGITATEDDVREGKAVFVITPGGTPIDIEIPQYAWHINNETRSSKLWIIIQAEEQKGVKAYGAVDPETGGTMAGLENEFVLIGDELPS